MQILNFIPAEEVYGAKSRLVEQVGPEPLSGVASLGGVYQIATAIIALLFIFILVRHFALFRHLIETSVSKQKKNTDNHVILVEPGDTDSSKLRWELVKVESITPTLDKSSIVGEWTVIWHAGREGAGEIVTFDATNMKDHVNGELKLDATYAWDEHQENTFYIEAMNDYFTVYRTDADTIMLIQHSINGIWELQAK